MWGLGRVSGGQDGSEQRIEVFVNIIKKNSSGVGFGRGGGSGWM